MPKTLDLAALVGGFNRAAFALGYAARLSTEERPPMRTAFTLAWHRVPLGPGEFIEVEIDDLYARDEDVVQATIERLGIRLIGVELLDMISKAERMLAAGPIPTEFVGGYNDGRQATLPIERDGLPFEYWRVPMPANVSLDELDTYPTMPTNNIEVYRRARLDVARGVWRYELKR